MYMPDHFRETNRDLLHALIREHPLATVVTTTRGVPDVNHLPMVLQVADNGARVLRGHVARANPVWQDLDTSVQAVAAFHGPSAYISPAWYPSKALHGRVVPTWNYAVAHAHGTIRAVEDRDWLRAHVSALTASQETQQASPWQVSDAPAEFVATMLDHIVGIELAVDSLIGKWKFSQNRSESDRRGVVTGLKQLGDPQSLAVAQLVGEQR